MDKLSRKVGVGIHNHFDIEVIDAKTGEIKQRAQAFNVVCDGLFRQLISDKQAYGTRIAIGSGTGTPSYSDTALFNNRGTYSVSDISRTSNRRDLITRVVRAVIGVSDAVGVNITEVGLMGPSRLSSHAMLQDMNGNPISILKTDTDVINIYATIYVHFTSTQGIFFDGLQVWRSGSYEGSYSFSAMILGLHPATWGDESTGMSTSHWEIYTADQNDKLRLGSGGNNPYERSGATPVGDMTNKTLTFGLGRINVGEGNIGGIGRMMIYGGIYSNPVYYDFLMCPYSDTSEVLHYSVTGESVGTGDGSTTKFKTKFRFPYNATVYVNGTPIQSGVTVKRLGLSNSGGENVHLLDSSSTNGNRVPRLGDARSGSAGWVENLGYSEGYPLYKTSSGTFNDLYGSNDLENWVALTTPQSMIDNVYRFYKNSSSFSWNNATLYGYDGYNIIFDTPPANGDVITIDYTTDYIPKDADHVLDATLTLTFGQWQGE